MNKVSFLFAVILGLYISFEVYRGAYSPILTYWWLASIVCLILPIVHRPKFFSGNFLSKKTVLLVFLLVLPIAVRIANFDITRLHTDDILTGYFSAHYDFLKINLFSGIPQSKVDWVSQFPTTYFVLQKLFFLVFGESIYTIKLSVMPYVLIIALMLFLIGKELLNYKLGVFTVILYSYFAVSLYFETWGLHFTSSTAVFCIFFYFIMKQFRKTSVTYSILSGITAGLCYLFYITSFIAIPFLFGIYIFQFIRERKIAVVKHFLLALISLLVILGPYLTYAYKFDNYFVSRIDQVSLLSGSWSIERGRIESGENPMKIIKENIDTSVKSLYMNGYGGHGGYIFHNLAFIEKMTLYLFAIGSVIAFILMIKKAEFLFIFGVLIASFATMVFSIPPPAYQRLLISIPFIAIIASLPLFVLISLNKTPFSLRLITGSLILITYIISNVQYFHTSVIKETNNINLQVASHINNNYPNRNVYMASFPGYIFEKIYYFAPGKNAKTITTGYHEDLLKTFNPKEKYVYVILYPDTFNEKFAALDTNGRFVDFYNKNNKMYSLFTN